VDAAAGLPVDAENPQPVDPAAPPFWPIADERRWRAARAAGLASVPATIRFADARQALVLADLENNPVLRVHLSAAEEARFARRFLAECAGNRAEAARPLGWTRARSTPHGPRGSPSASI
jgi:ParB/RepB/Spo0J family partition protein